MAIILKCKVVSAQPNPQGGNPGSINVVVLDSGATDQAFGVIPIQAAAADIAGLTIGGTATLTLTQP